MVEVILLYSDSHNIQRGNISNNSILDEEKEVSFYSKTDKIAIPGDCDVMYI